MKIIKQLFWIFVFSFAGELISYMLPIAIPGSVLGMVLLFFFLHFGWIKMQQVEEAANWLTDNMAIFFVPAGVGLMTNFDVLAETWWQILIIMLISTVFMMAFVGKIVQRVKQRTEQKQQKEEVHND